MRINIKVIPKSSREEIVTVEGVIKAYVKAAPDKGKANKALIALVAKKYKVPKSKISIVTGQTNRNKIVEIEE